MLRSGTKLGHNQVTNPVQVVRRVHHEKVKWQRGVDVSGQQTLEAIDGMIGAGPRGIMVGPSRRLSNFSDDSSGRL
jgi:hypothetical protein